MPRLKPLTATADERVKLQAWVRRPKTSQRLALRPHIVLAAADGRGNTAIAAEPRPGPPRTITDAHVEDAVTRTLESPPSNATHGSTRRMAKATGRSQTAVSRIWRAFGLQPHRHETFKLPAGPYSVEKVRGVVGLYLDPPDRAVS